MLVWTQKKRGAKIQIALLERPKLFNRELLIGLSIALIAHLLFFGFFKIQLGMLADPLAPLPLTVLPSIRTTGVTVNQPSRQMTEEELFLAKPIRQELPTSLSFKLPPDELTIEIPSKTVKALRPTFRFSRGIVPRHPLELKPVKIEEPLFASLEIEADPASGKIYFYEWMQRSGDKNLDQAIEQFIKELKLEITDSAAVTATLEISFND